MPVVVLVVVPRVPVVGLVVVTREEGVGLRGLLGVPLVLRSRRSRRGGGDRDLGLLRLRLPGLLRLLVLLLHGLLRLLLELLLSLLGIRLPR